MSIKNCYVALFLFLVACSSSEDSSEQELKFNLSELKKVSSPDTTSTVAPKFELRSKSHKHYWYCSSASDCYTEYSGSFFLHDLNTGVVPLWASIETDLRHGTCKANFELNSHSEYYNYQMNSKYAEYGWTGKNDGRTERIVGKATLRSPLYGIWQIVWKSEACD